MNFFKNKIVLTVIQALLIIVAIVLPLYLLVLDHTSVVLVWVNYTFYVLSSIWVVLRLRPYIVNTILKKGGDTDPYLSIYGHPAIFYSSLVYFIATLILLCFTMKLDRKQEVAIYFAQIVMLLIALTSRFLLSWAGKRLNKKP